MLYNMAKWKLIRQQFGNEEFELSEGQVTIGRGLNNKIKLSSIVISRNHCFIHVKEDEVFITDSKSSNGVYVGRKKINPNNPYKLTNNDIIGFGWTSEAPVENIKDDQKHVYKLIKYGDCIKTPLKRKLSKQTLSPDIVIENENNLNAANAANLDHIATENKNTKENESSKAKKAKEDPILIDDSEDENEDLEYEVFKDNQHNRMFNDEIVLSDSDYESEHLIERLSQNSPGRPFIKLEIKREKSVNSIENSSYSQIDDDIPIELFEDSDQEECKSPQILLIPDPAERSDLGDNNNVKLTKEIETFCSGLGDNNNMQLPKDIEKHSSDLEQLAKEVSRNLCDLSSSWDKKTKDSEKDQPPIKSLANGSNESCKKKQFKKPITQPPKRTSLNTKLRSKSNVPKRNKKSSTSSKKNTLTNSQKEKRRNKLKEISRKEKEKKSTTSELDANAVIQEFNKNNDNGDVREISEALSSRKQQGVNKSKSKILPPPQKSVQIIEALYQNKTNKRIANVQKSQLEKSNENLPPKNVEKRVSFGEPLVKIHKFKIELGNKMEKIHYLIDGPKRKKFSQKEIALMKILNWNTRWLEEQIKCDQPPPVVEKENLSMLFLSFKNHQQYQGQVRNLLLLEIWEYITQGYKDNKRRYLNFKIEDLPSKPPRERYCELFTICVKLDISTSDNKFLPRDGDIMMIKSRLDNKDKWRFCFVKSANIKTCSLSMYVKYSDEIESFSLGEIIFGINIANINNIVWLFEAMERLSETPLRKIILQPEPCQYPKYKPDDAIITKSKWTASLNASQLRAVTESVNAALDKSPALRMVQGPPGTGKSSVICAMVMSYFYDGPAVGKQSNRKKILICATSNAAVDELVIKLLKMMEKLPTEQRLRMVRVGRQESMHVRAKDISSQALAERELARVRQRESERGLEDPTVREQIQLYTAKWNMWRNEKSEDPARAAYCEDRATHCAKQIELLRGSGGEASSEQLVIEERRLVERADVIATTLSSAVNHKMRQVSGIELCIVDEAGQAIEPETLLPLILGVTKITLVGDPQQLPGFICSQRAKKYGLDKSLFSRLSSYSEDWEQRPMVLLDHQYRMHPAIADYPNRAFYAGQVQSVPPASVRLDLPPYCILAIPGNGRDPECEARGASLTAAALALAARAHDPPLDVAVITPHVAHRESVRTHLGELMREYKSEPVEVKTVDSFQGQERDVVVVSLGRRRGVGFLAEAGRMNVLLTRARHVLIVCLDPDAVREHRQWRTLIEDAQNKRLFKTLPHTMCHPSSLREISPKEVLNFLKK